MKYVVNATPLIKRIFAGEPYAEEWFDVKQRADTGTILVSTDGSKSSERIAALVVSLLVDWSIRDDKGAKPAITVEMFNSLPPEMTMPLLDMVQQPDFLDSLTKLKLPGQSQP